MEKEKKSKGSLVVIIILIVLLLGACAYIGYDKFFLKKDNQVNDNNENKGVEKLDVNSRLVQSLYNRVSIGELKKEVGKCGIFMYDYDKDFYASTAEEKNKMQFVGNLLTPSKQNEYVGDESLIPDTIPNYDYYESVISSNKNYGGYKIEYYYDRSYIENLYKEIFGSNAKLDTSVVIEVGEYKAELYHYIPSIDKYVLYINTLGVGGTCGPWTKDISLQKATKDGNKLKIYETETEFIMGDASDSGDRKYEVSSKNNYVYTFELEDDGMYKFVSRVKEN